MAELDKSYPNPDHKNWEKEYIYSKAQEDAVSRIFNVIVTWKSESSQLVQEKKDDRNESIEDA